MNQELETKPKYVMYRGYFLPLVCKDDVKQRLSTLWPSDENLKIKQVVCLDDTVCCEDIVMTCESCVWNGDRVSDGSGIMEESLEILKQALEL